MRESEKTRGVRRDDWFCTASGRVCFARAPDMSDICIDDIASSLARICRFNGHLRSDVPFYSVAQHSVLVSLHVPQELALEGLMHDAPEYVLGDIMRPVKRDLPDYRSLERVWARAIGAEFGLHDRLDNLHAEVKRADDEALATERRDVVRFGERSWSVLATPWSERIVPMSPMDARGAFLQRFSDLMPAGFVP